MKDTAVVGRNQALVTECTCGGDHQLVIALKVGKTDSGCWEWAGALNRDGYAVVTHAGRPWLAHRLSYFAFVGQIPPGLVVDHLCFNRACVNPGHLEPVTDRVNIMRSNGISALNARKTHCIRGHELAPPDVDTVQHRQCLPCARRSQALRIRTTVLLPDDTRHGTVNGYGNLGCRCAECCAANTARHREYMRVRATSWRAA